MDYEKAYKDAIERAKRSLEEAKHIEYNMEQSAFDIRKTVYDIFPELKESEDEKTAKEIKNFILYKAGHLLDEKTEHRFIKFLEKQKEQNPIEPSDDELQRHQDELYDFKVFAVKQAKEHHIHISFVHDFEWHNFCAELLSYFNEKHTTDGKAMLHVAEKSYQIGLRDGRIEQKPAEWSDKLEIDILRDWSIRFSPDIRAEIEATAYHFYNLGVNARREGIK